jgi:acetylornithine deacetylase/succinyl-diaminopimelate desuccinylase-like protein
VLDLRLVRGNDHQRQVAKVVAHVKKMGYYVTETEPTEAERLAHPLVCRVERKSGYNAQRTKMDLPLAKAVIAAVQATTPHTLILHPTSGGSLPLYLFEQHVPAPTISVPIVNHDNNQHGENENLRLQNLWDGLETLAAVMMMR